MPLGAKYELGLFFPASEVKMSDSPIKYRLIKKEKHTGARLGEIITPHGTFPDTYVYASWDPSHG